MIFILLIKVCVYGIKNVMSYLLFVTNEIELNQPLLSGRADHFSF